MTLLLFKYVLPALLGYTLFVGIAGRFNPAYKPESLEERPSWMLGIWTGLCVLLVLSIGLHMAYGMPLEAAKDLAKPAFLTLTGLLGAGFIAYLTYCHLIRLELESNLVEQEASAIDWTAKVTQLDPLFTPSMTQSSNGEKTFDTSRKEPEVDRAAGAIIELSHQQLKRLEGDTNETRETMSTGSKLEDLEATVIQLRKELVTSRHEVRKHVAARAKALSTANKSIAFARQTIELRAQLENELSGVRETLAIRQSTIARLIQRLETEKRLSPDELALIRGCSAINDETIAPTPMKDGTTN